MKKLFTVLLGLVFYISASAQISTFPWVEDFESQSTCGTSCSGSCVLTGSMTNATTGDQQDWLAIAGATGSSNTGPSVDHTTGTNTGIYLYIENSGCATTDEAHLESDTFDFTNVAVPELHFWYHMYGADMDSMHLDVNTGSGWVLDALGPGWIDNIDLWQEQVFNLAAYGNTSFFQFRIRGKHGSSFGADMAVDDFSIISLTPDNVGTISIDNPALPTCALANQTVMATIKNFGSNALDSVMVNWAVNGVAQTPVSYTTQIIVDGTAQVSLGTYSFSSFDVLDVWTSMPNGVADTQTGNDSMSLTLNTGLTGTFTIDSLLPASSTNYQSFTDAVAAITTNGLCGPVTFNVAAGTWNQNVVLPDWGGSMTNAVTFNGSGMGVTNLNYDGSGGTNAVVLFDGADWVTIKNMTIERTAGGTYHRAVRMHNASDHNTIDSCELIVDNTSTSSLYNVFCASASATSTFGEGDNANYTTLSNCHFYGGYYQVQFEGKPGIGNYNVYNQVINCTFNDAYAYNLYADEQDSLTVIGCTMNGSRATFGYGINVFDQMHPNFQNNVITGMETYGIYIADGNFDVTPSARGFVINNMVSAKGTGDALYLDDCEDIDVFHNSLYAENDPAFYANDFTGTDVRNNIFYSRDNNAVEILDNPTGFNDFDYNLVYTETGVLARIQSTNYTDTAALHAAHPVTINTTTGNPNFNDVNNDLHVSVGPGLVAGDNSVGVMTDIDGDARPLAPTTVVDLGADEILVQNLDAAITSFDQPGAPVVAGLQDIKVTIKNNGVTPLTSATIGWSVDGVAQTPFAWTGNLPIGEADDSVTIGQYNILDGFTSFEIWTDAPNGGIDGDPSNDTLYYDLCTGLKGNYTVGPGMMDDFPDLASAADALSYCGVDSAVHITIAPGIYTGHVNFDDILGASGTNNITIDGMDRDSVLITYTSGSNSNGDYATVRFSGADHVTLQNMSIEALGTINSWGVHYWKGADNNTIQDCRILMDLTTTSSSVAGVIATNSLTSAFAYSDNANNLTIQDNEIIGGYYGVRLNGANTGGQPALNQSNRIEGNDFYDVYAYPMYVIYQAGTVLKDNYVPDLRSTGFGYGLYAADVMNLTVEGNFLNGAGTYGISLWDINFDYAATKRSKIINNMVTVDGTFAEALWLDDVESTDIYYNTFKSTGEQAFYNNDVLNLDVRNNIFVSETATTVDFNDGIGTTNVLNYNVYHRTDGSGNLLEFGSNAFSDLVSWQTDLIINNGQYDANSHEGDPIFQDIAIGDLHVIGGVANDVADITVPVFVDIDGDVRPDAPSITPDIGADEYTPLNDDAKPLDIVFTPAICGSATDTVWVTVQNLGLNTITVLPLTVDVTGGGVNTSLSTTAAVNIPFLGTENVMVGTFNSTAGGDYNFTAYSALAGDQDAENDTIDATGGRFHLDAIINDVLCLGDTSGTIDLLLLNALGLGGGLTTSFANNNGSGGNMFDVDVLGPNLQITGFEVNLTSGASVDIWYKSGTYVGHENTAGSWTYYGNVPVAAAGAGSATIVTLPTTLVLGNGTNALFLAAPNSWNYINGTTVGSVWASNNDLIIYEGIGRSTNTFTASIFQPRNFSGSIIYQAGNPSITWSTGDTTESISGLTGGTYYVTVSDGIGCTTNDSFYVDQPTSLPPTVTMGGSTNVSCFGLADGSITATVTGGTGNLTYNWSNGATTQNLMNVGAGTYSLMVTDANGCTDSTGVMGVSITQPDTLVALLGTVSTIGCDSVEIQTSVTGGNSGITFSWSGGGTDSTLLVTGSGTYVATVSDMMGCTDTLSAMVTFPAAVSATATMMDADTAGNGVGSATVTATDGTAPYTYLWSDGQTTMTATGLAAGNYTVTVTDAAGCETTATVTVGFPTGLTGIDAFSTLEMFPNPTSGMVTFNVAMKASTDLTISIFDVAGKEVTTFTRGNAMMFTERYDASHLPEGVYMVRFIAGEEGVVTKRLVVGTK